MPQMIVVRHWLSFVETRMAILYLGGILYNNSMIRSVALENFKSIKKASLAMQKFAMVIGKNGSGKSTLISAISLTQRLVGGMTLQEALKTIAPLANELFYFFDDKNRSDIELVIETASGVIYKLRYSISLEEKEAGRRLTITNEILYKVVDRQDVVVYKREEDGVLTYPSTEEPVKIPLKVNSDKLALSAYSNDEVNELTNLINGYTILDSLNEKKNGVTVVSGEHPDLKTLDGLVVSLYNKSPELFKKAVEATQQIIPEFGAPAVGDLSKLFLDNLVTPQEGPVNSEGLKDFVVIWKEKQQNRNYTSVSLSGGNIRTIYLIFSLFHSPTNSFMAIEEIENGMHIERISKIIEQFRTQSNNRKIQMLFTTHSLEVLNHVIPQETIYCSKSIEEGSQYKLLSETEEFEVIKEDLGKKNITGRDLLEAGLFS